MEIVMKQPFMKKINLGVWVCKLVIRSGIVHRAVDDTHWVRPVARLILIKRQVGIFYFPKQLRNRICDANNSNIRKEKNCVADVIFEKEPATNCQRTRNSKSNPTQLDHEIIKLIHLLKSHFSPLKVGFRSLSRVLVPLMSKEPPVPKQSQHHMGEEEHKQTTTRTKDAKTHERRSTNTPIAIKFYLDLRNFFQRSFDRCIGCISHLFHPFMINFTTKYLKQMEIIQSLTQQNHRCVALLTTSKEQNS